MTTTWSRHHHQIQRLRRHTEPITSFNVGVENRRQTIGEFYAISGDTQQLSLIAGTTRRRVKWGNFGKGVTLTHTVFQIKYMYMSIIVLEHLVVDRTSLILHSIRLNYCLLISLE